MKRKDFLKITAGAVAGSIISPAVFAGSFKKNTNKLGIKKSLKFGMIKEDLSVMDKFKLLKDIGFMEWSWIVPIN